MTKFSTQAWNTAQAYSNFLMYWLNNNCGNFAKCAYRTINPPRKSIQSKERGKKPAASLLGMRVMGSLGKGSQEKTN